MAVVLRSHRTPTSQVELGQRHYSQLNAFAGQLQEEKRVKIFPANLPLRQLNGSKSARELIGSIFGK